MASKQSDEDAEQAQREAEEAARRARIQKEISEKQAEISSLSSVKAELNVEKSDMVNSVNKWNQAKTVFQKSEINSSVVVKNVFEGNAAESIKKENFNKIDSMDTKNSKAGVIKDGITAQTTRVNGRISTLNTQIVNLRSQL